MSWIDRMFGRAVPEKPVSAPMEQKPIPVPATGGRLTRGTDNVTGKFGGMLVAPSSPETDWRRLDMDAKTLDKMTPANLAIMLADLSPDVSRALWDWIRIGCPGWKIQAFVPGTETEHTEAQMLLNQFVDNLQGPYVNQVPGADVVFGMVMSNMFVRGAALMELVLDKSGRIPLNIALPDPIYCRFKQVTHPTLGDGYELGQFQNGKWVAFDRPTIVYVPVDPVTAYGRPVAASSLNTSIFLVAMMNDLRRVVQQQGWPRSDISVDFEAMAATMPSDAEGPEALQAWAQKIINDIKAVYESLEPDDMYVHSNVVTVNKPTGAMDPNALGSLGEMIRTLERRVVRSLKTQPVFMGINEATTETHAIQQWEIQIQGARSIQHRIEFALERLLSIVLQVQGVQATVRFRFAELQASELERYARTEAMQIANEKNKRDQGWITNDEASMAITGHMARGEPTYQPMATTEGYANERPREDSNIPRQRILITPNGANKPLKPLPPLVHITAAQEADAIELFDDLIPEYAGMLNAVVEGDNEPQ